MHPTTRNWLMGLRPMSQFLSSYVVPEIKRRVADGDIPDAALPFQITQFQIVQGGGENRIEINEEVKVAVTVRSRNAGTIKPGQLVTLEDIDPSECYFARPEINGVPGAYFLCQSHFLNFQNVFDFEPNGPDWDATADDARSVKFEIAEYVRSQQMLDVMKPDAAFQRLADANWPPGPAYYPTLIWRMHEAPGLEDTPRFCDLVGEAYSPDYLSHRIGWWTETKFFESNRLVYVQKSIEEFLEGDYISSIYVLVPHFEGIIRDYLRSVGHTPKPKIRTAVAQLKSVVLSRSVLMFPRSVVGLIFEFIANGTIFADTNAISDPAKQVTRHGTAHGVFTKFEDKEIALKYLILLDALAYVILHDKVLTGQL